MLYRLLLIVLILDSLVLIAAILLQAGKGSGLAANFGGASSSPDAFIGVRQAGTILTKATWWCAGIFLGLAFVLQVMSTRAQAPRSVLEKTFSNHRHRRPLRQARLQRFHCRPQAHRPRRRRPRTGGTTAPPATNSPIPLTPAPPAAPAPAAKK